MSVPSHTRGSTYLMGVSMQGRHQKRLCRSQFPSRNSSSSCARCWHGPRGRDNPGGGGSWNQPSLQDASQGGFEEDTVRSAAVPALRAGPGAAHCLPAGWKPQSPQLLHWPGKRLTADFCPATLQGGERRVPRLQGWVCLVLLFTLCVSCLREHEKLAVTFLLPYAEQICLG